LFLYSTGLSVFWPNCHRCMQKFLITVEVISSVCHAGEVRYGVPVMGSTSSWHYRCYFILLVLPGLSSRSYHAQKCILLVHNGTSTVCAVLPLYLRYLIAYPCALWHIPMAKSTFWQARDYHLVLVCMPITFSELLTVSITFSPGSALTLLVGVDGHHLKSLLLPKYAQVFRAS
jgi:hypothetical protein